MSLLNTAENDHRAFFPISDEENALDVWRRVFDHLAVLWQEDRFTMWQNAYHYLGDGLDGIRLFRNVQAKKEEALRNRKCTAHLMLQHKRVGERLCFMGASIYSEGPMSITTMKGYVFTELMTAEAPSFQEAHNKIVEILRNVSSLSWLLPLVHPTLEQHMENFWTNKIRHSQGENIEIPPSHVKQGLNLVQNSSVEHGYINAKGEFVIELENGDTLKIAAGDNVLVERDDDYMSPGCTLHLTNKEEE